MAVNYYTSPTNPASPTLGQNLQGPDTTYQDTHVNAPPGMYWKDPNTLAMIPDPAIGTAAGATQNAYTTAATPGLAGLINGTGGTSSASGGGGSLSPLTSLSSAAGLGGSGTAGVGGVVGSGTTASAGAIAPIDNTAANSAAFGAAKDTAGQLGRSSLDSLRSLLGETGQLGGGTESQGTRDIVENAAGQLGQVSRDQATTQSGQALDIAKTNQGSAVTQRGQDIQAQEAAAQLQLAQQEFLSNQSLNALKLALSGSSATPTVANSLY